MNFKPLASSSRGNCYLLSGDSVAPLLIEAGIPFSAIQEYMGFRVTSIEGCLVSHEHLDHSKAVKHLMKYGVDCYMSAGTLHALGYPQGYHRAPILLEAGVEAKIGEWRVLPFALKHDAKEPLGFLIGLGDEKLLFIPDTAYIKNTFKGITQIAVECNYIDEILSDNILSGALPSVVGHRVRRNHMSLNTLINMLKANDLSRCTKIYLLHLSRGNADEEIMRRRVQEETSIPTEICEE